MSLCWHSRTKTADKQLGSMLLAQAGCDFVRLIFPQDFPFYNRYCLQQVSSSMDAVMRKLSLKIGNGPSSGLKPHKKEALPDWPLKSTQARLSNSSSGYVSLICLFRLLRSTADSCS